MPSKFSSNTGFTLLELMIVVAIVGILTAVAVPSFQDMIKNNRLTITANELVADLNLARSESVKRGLPVVICKSSTGTDCTSGSWAQGWIVFTDRNNNQIFDNTSSNVETILKVEGAASGSIVMTETRSFFPFKASGGLSSLAGSVTICDDRVGQSVGKRVIVITTGRPATSTRKYVC